MQENRERMVAVGVLSDFETGRRSSKKQHSLVLNRRTFMFLGSITESKIQKLVPVPRLFADVFLL